MTTPNLFSFITISSVPLNAVSPSISVTSKSTSASWSFIFNIFSFFTKINQNVNAGVYGELRYNVRAGIFTEKKDIAFMDKLKVEEDMISAQLDNVLSIAILVYLYELGYQGTAFFTSSEEAGKSWRFLLEYFRRFDITTNELLVLDTSPYKSIDDIKSLDVVLRNRDENGYFRSPLKTKIKKIAIKNRIKYFINF